MIRDRQVSTSPPDFAIRAAVDAGSRSPCAKSKRGAAAFDPEIEGFSFGTGYNGQPTPFACTADAACKAACSKRCVHAEMRAIRGLLPAVARGLEIVHAKVIDGRLVAGGGPSCWQCSREILDVGLAAVWLFQPPTVAEHNAMGIVSMDDPRFETIGWRRYTAVEFHSLTLAACGIGAP